MDNSNSDQLPVLREPNKSTSPKTGFLFISLIVLLFYSAPLLASAAGADLSKYTDYLYLYTVIGYSVIILSIIIFHGRRFYVLQDHFSLWVIVLGCFLAASQGGTHDTVYRIFLIVLGVRLAIYILRHRKNFKIPRLRSIFIGLLWSIVTISILSVSLFLLNPVHEPLPPNLSAYFLNTILYQVSFVTVIEEACFRGLLFGFLMMNGYEEDRALIIQAILFWGSHYLKVSDISLFFVAIPLLTLSVTLIVKRYKMLYLAVMVHTLVNVLTPVLVLILSHFR